MVATPPPPPPRSASNERQKIRKPPPPPQRTMEYPKPAEEEKPVSKSNNMEGTFSNPIDGMVYQDEKGYAIYLSISKHQCSHPISGRNVRKMKFKYDMSQDDMSEDDIYNDWQTGSEVKISFLTDYQIRSVLVIRFCFNLDE
jgi:hypothetical protein